MTSPNDSLLKKLRYYLLAALVIALMVIVKMYFFPKEKAASGPGMSGAAKPVNVTVEVVSAIVADNSIFVSGTLLAGESVDLQPEAQGKITGIYFSEGQRVSKGQLLLKLNDAELQAQLKKSQAQEKIAAEKTARLKKLLDISGVSREEYESALVLWQSHQADIEALRAAIDKTELRAPFSGTIGLRYVSPGSFAAPGMRIATLQQLDQLKLDFSIPEKYLSAVKNGDMVNFTIEGLSEQFSGRIYAIDPLIDQATRSVKLRALCSNGGGKLRPGAFARVKLALQAGTKALMVPTESLIPDMTGQKVFVVKNGEAVPKMVKTGIRTSDRIEITEGVSAGDSIIVTGVMMVKPGSKILVISTK